MKITKIKNYDEIANELAKLFVQFEKDMNEFQTNVYLYVDENTKTASLDIVANVDGNPRLGDDYVTMYRDEKHDESIYDYFDSIADIAEALDMSVEELVQAVKDDIHSKGYEITDDVEIEPHDVEEYLSYRSDLYEKLYDAYCEWIENDFGSYLNVAHSFLELSEICELETPKEKGVER